MSVIYREGSIFETEADSIVCPVNCVGVMGKGLALEFKKRWYGSYCEYANMCSRNAVFPGSVFLTSDWIGAATKDHWRSPSRIEWVDECLKRLSYYSRDVIAIPQLGCGCGELEWRDVEPLYRKHFDGRSVLAEVWIYREPKMEAMPEPEPKPEEQTDLEELFYL